MSKKESIQVLNSDMFYQFIYGDNASVGGDMWDQARNGGRTGGGGGNSGARSGALSRGAPNVGSTGASVGPGVFGFEYDAGRNGMYYVYNCQIAFDTSGITEPPSKLSILFGNHPSLNSNTAPDHKFIITAVQGATLPQDEATNTGVGQYISAIRKANDSPLSSPLASSTVDDFLIGLADGGTNARDGNPNYAAPYEGFISGSSFAETGRFYCEPQNVSDYVALTSTLFEIELNRNARRDVVVNDYFHVNFTDYTFNVLYQDPASSSPSPGAFSRVALYIAGMGGVYKGTTVQGPPRLQYTIGQVGKSESEPKEKFEQSYTINAFENMTSQRVRYVQKDGTVSDQVPFQLATKGPLSLRGRELTEDGGWEGSADPPVTKKN